MAWGHIVSAFIGSGSLQSLESQFGQAVVRALERIGFAPVDTSYLPGVAKAGWVLLITNFSAVEFLGLMLYVLFLPLALLLYILAIKVLRLPVVPEQKAPQPQQRSSPWPWTSACACAFFAWVLLYGESGSAGPNALGLLLSAFLFLVYGHYSFQRTRPVDVDELRFAARMKAFGLGTLHTLAKRMEKGFATRAEATLQLRMASASYRVYRRAALVLRGRRGKNRIATLVLVEYVISLVLLGAAAIVFWGTAIKYVSSPRAMSFSEALWRAASSFLPTLPAPTEIGLPFWTRFGPAATAFVLFVVFVGPAASLLPSRQRAYREQVEQTYVVFRRIARLLKRERRMFVKIEAGMAASGNPWLGIPREQAPPAGSATQPAEPSSSTAPPSGSV